MITKIDIYFLYNPWPFVLNNFLNVFIILFYFLNVILFYLNFFENFILFFMPGDDPNNFNNNSQNQPNNPNWDEFLADYEKKKWDKPYPKTYLTPNGKILTRDGDSLTNSEMFFRKTVWKAENLINHQNYNIKRMEKYYEGYSAVTSFNLAYNKLSNPYSFKDATAFNTPFSKPFKHAGGAFNMLYSEGGDIVKGYYGKPIEDSLTSQKVYEASPFKKQTYKENDTWDDSLTKGGVVKPFKDRCDIF